MTIKICTHGKLKILLSDKNTYLIVKENPSLIFEKNFNNILKKIATK